MAEKRQGTIDEILKRIDLVELINEVTPLKKKGKNYMGLCPFHEEKTPSFSVSEDKQLYHCFSCKAGGNALTFVKEHWGLSSAEAIRYLGDRVGVTVDESPAARRNRKYFEINRAAANFYKVQLTNLKSGEPAREYLKQRGLTRESLDTFELGFAPASKDALYQAMSSKEYLKSDLSDLGLIREKQDVYDVFRERIIFPVQDGEGNVLGFSGRTFKESKAAKYINSPRTPLFEKQSILYNLHRAKRPAKESGRVVLFEGFMDVIMAHQAGVREGIAIMGTAFTRPHVEALKGITQTLIICFDGDAAGEDATMRFLRDLRQAPFEVRIARLPKDTDPDDYIREHGAKAFRERIDQAVDRTEYLYEAYRPGADASISELDRFKQKVFALIRPLSSLAREHYLKRLSEDIGVSVATLEEDYDPRARRPRTPTYTRSRVPEVTDKFRRAERAFIHYFIKSEHYARRFRREFEDVTYVDKDARDIQFEIFEYYDFNRQSCIVPELFAARLNQPQREYFSRHIDCAVYPYSDQEFEDLLRVMREYTRRNRIRTLKRRLAEAEALEEKIRYKQKIDALLKEAKHGKRKDRTGTD